LLNRIVKSALLVPFASLRQPLRSALGGKRESLFESAANNPEQKTRLQREIKAADGQIDQLVYELYGLTEEEIEIVEEATNRSSLA